MAAPAAGLDYMRLRAEFRWRIPPRFNIGVACVDDQPPAAPALIAPAADGALREYSFGEVAAQSNRLANGLRDVGIDQGDRVGIVLPQRVETLLSHVAVYKLGAVAVPIAVGALTPGPRLLPVP